MKYKIYYSKSYYTGEIKDDVGFFIVEGKTIEEIHKKMKKGMKHISGIAIELEKIEEEKKKKKIRCKWCGRKYNEETGICCWIHCECGEKICGMCGSNKLVDMDLPKDENGNYEDDVNFWCGVRCGDCGQEGCAMCV